MLPPLTGVGARGSSEKDPVVDLSSSSDEGDLIANVLYDTYDEDQKKHDDARSISRMNIVILD
jgi:hypothetical protein